MKHLKIYESFGDKGPEYTMSVSNSLIDLIGCDPGDLYPGYILHDYDDDELDEDDEDYDQKKEEHEKAVDNIDTEKYLIEIIPYIQKWFDEDEDEGKSDLIDTLPFIKNVKFEKFTRSMHGQIYLDMDIIVNPKEMTTFILNLLEDSSFLPHVQERFRSYDGGSYMLPTTSREIVEILEQTNYDQYYNLLVVMGEYLRKDFEPKEYSIQYYLSEKFEKSIYDFQK